MDIRFIALACAVTTGCTVQVFNPEVNTNVAAKVDAAVAVQQPAAAPTPVPSFEPIILPTIEVSPAPTPEPTPKEWAKVSGSAFTIDGEGVRPEDGVSILVESMDAEAPYKQTATGLVPFAFYQVPVGHRMVLTARSEKFAPLTRYFTIPRGAKVFTLNLGGPPSGLDEQGSGYFLIPKSRMKPTN